MSSTMEPRFLIAEILGGGPDDEFYDSKVKVLSEEIEHHVEEEEKRMEGLFAQARKAGIDMDALGHSSLKGSKYSPPNTNRVACLSPS